MDVVPTTSTAVSLIGGSALAVADELVGRIRTELPVVGGFGQRGQLLVSAWLIGLRSARTRRAYAADMAAWLAWLADRDIDVLTATRVDVDLWVDTQLTDGGAARSVRRRLSAVAGFYRYCASHDLIGRLPTDGVTRPEVDPDYTATMALDRAQTRVFLAAADADTGPQHLRTQAAARLLAHNGLRVDELCQANVDDLGYDHGHRVLDFTRKGARLARIPLAAPTIEALHAYLDQRAATLGPGERLTGPLLATATGRRLHQKDLWQLVRRLAREAGIEAWSNLSPHSLRHTSITLTREAGVELRDVQIFAGRYDHTRASLDRNATYAVAAYLS